MSVRNLDTAGIDLGGSLTKIAHGKKPELAIFPSLDLDAILAYIKAKALTHLVLTGGGSVRQRAAFADFRVETADEFEAIIRGTNTLLAQQGGAVFPYALVSIGTGTSVSKVEQSGGQRITGTAVGGGTIVGLGSLLTGQANYGGIIEKAARGDRSNVDVLVRDIYGGDLPGLSGEVTASNFGKARSRRPEDLAIALMQMVGEVLAVIGSLTAKNVNAEEVVYIGAALRENPILTEVLEFNTKFMGRRPRFVSHGEYAGALGALLQTDE
jgi:type II pantothenate kinase